MQIRKRHGWGSRSPHRTEVADVAWFLLAVYSPQLLNFTP